MATSSATTTWPDQLQRVATLDEGADGFHRSWIMLFPLGTFAHPQYGKLNFTRQRLAEIQRNFDARVRHIDIALDVDHKASGEDSRATGWIEELQLREATGNTPAGLWGRIMWTPYGMQLLQDREYRYFSPEFGPWSDPETGAKYDNVLIGGALTNRPFLKVMPAVALKEQRGHRGGSGGVEGTMDDENESQEQPVVALMGKDSTTKGSMSKTEDEAAGDEDAEELDDMGDDDAEAYAENDPDGDGDDDSTAEGDTDGDYTHTPAVSAKAKKGAKSSKMSERGVEQPFSLSEYLALREQVDTLNRKLYEREVESTVAKLTEKLPANTQLAPRFAEQVSAFLLGGGYQLAESTRGEVLTLLSEALSTHAVVDTRTLGSSYDQETRRTIRASEGRHGTEDELNLLETAERLALAEGKLQPGEPLTKLALAEREAIMSKAAKEIGYK